jgi:hypothetical protein
MENVSVEIVVSKEAKIIIDSIKTTLSKSPTGVSFVGINGYTNKFGEISNNTINIGASYEKAKLKDIETLKNVNLLKVSFNSDKITLEKARIELINSLQKPDKTRSIGQKNAYTHITTGLKVHNVTGEVIIYGFSVNKKIIQKGVYPVVNSRKLTIAKNELKEGLNLKTNKFKQYKISEINNIKISGNTLIF